MSEECKKCRICLESTSKDVVPLHLLVEVEKSYADIYEYLSGLIPNKGSQYLCYACREELLKAYEFKKKIQDCEKIWSVDIKIENDIPIEVAEIDIKPDTEALVFVSTLIPEIESEIPEGKTETRTRSKFHDDFQWPEISDAESDKNESQNAIESCPYCEATYKTHNRLYKHYYKTHKGHKLKCVDCNKEFLFFDPFVKHRRKKHQSSDIKRKFEIIYPTLSEDSKNAKTFECPFCPEVFNVKNRLTHHKKQQHPGMKLPKKDHNEQTICPECGIMIFVRALERHQRTAHNATPRETYICDLCGAKLVSKVGMGIHMQLKHLHTTFFCRHCTENFPTPGIRRTHEIRFHTKNYKHCCHLCDKKFITGVHLRINQLTLQLAALLITAHTPSKDWVPIERRMHFLAIKKTSSIMLEFCCPASYESNEIAFKTLSSIK
uniref:CSON015631 protein n=1 Tax=Culicoides sonorensis TaxID=179676 RepID=A0A336LWD8_CULSO